MQPRQADAALDSLADGAAHEGPAVELQRRVLRQFRIVLNAAKAHFHHLDAPSGMSNVQSWALSVIGARPGIGVNALAQALDICQPTASNVVKALVAQSLVESRRGPVDRRTVTLHLTIAGAQALHNAPGAFSGRLPAALAGMDGARLAMLEQGLNDVMAQMRKPAPEAA